MKFSELNSGTNYGVVPSWEYSSSDKKSPLLCSRRDVAKATLISLDKYEYKVYRSQSETDPEFKLAPKGSRSVGYLVSSDQYSVAGVPTTTYWLARPQDIVAPYDQLETRWNTEEAEEKLRSEKLKLEREEQERKEKEQRDYIQRVSNSLISSLRSVIGDRASTIQVDTSHRRQANGEYKHVAIMNVDLKTMEILVEKILEARDMVN